MTKTSANPLTPFSKIWDVTTNELRQKLAYEGYAPEVAEWVIRDARPRMERVIAGEHVETMLFDLELEYLSALMRGNLSVEPKRQAKPVPNWLVGVVDGFKRN